MVLDESGFSKGYGFVRFGSEAEQQHALSSMSGEMGLGSKPIKTSMANQKSRSENGEWELSNFWRLHMALFQVGECRHHQVSGAEECHPGILRQVERLVVGGSLQGPSQVVCVVVIVFIIMPLFLGRSWSDIGGTPSSPPSGGPGGPLSAATSAGPDYSAYHQYYQQFAQ